MTDSMLTDQSLAPVGARDQSDNNVSVLLSVCYTLRTYKYIYLNLTIQLCAEGGVCDIVPDVHQMSSNMSFRRNNKDAGRQRQFLKQPAASLQLVCCLNT